MPGVPDIGWGKSPSGVAARVWAGAFGVATLVVGVLNLDPEALLFGAGIIAFGLVTRWRKGLIGRVGLGILALDGAVWMVPAVVVNARDGASLRGLLPPVVLSVLSVAVLALVLAVRPIVVLGSGLLVMIGGVAWSVAAAADQPPRRADVFLRVRNGTFDKKVVTAPAGSTLAVRNDDLFWHTFTVPDLDIDVRLATRARRAVVIDAPPGSYRFVCAIPGHDQGGMNGRLVVE
jgi:plastocyanin